MLKVLSKQVNRSYGYSSVQAHNLCCIRVVALILEHADVEATPNPSTRHCFQLNALPDLGAAGGRGAPSTATVINQVNSTHGTASNLDMLVRSELEALHSE